MKTVRCERQSLAVILSMAFFAGAGLFLLAANVYTVGPEPVFVILGLMLPVYLGNSLKGAYEALSSYEYDDDRVIRRFVLGRTVTMRWSDVADFWIRRSTGDASVFLKDAAGRGLRLDFQLMGPAGGELFGVMTRRLKPIIDAKLLRMDGELVRFRRRHIGWIPLPGSISAGRGVIQGRGRAAITLANVDEVLVKQVKKLVTTLDYTLRERDKILNFLSYLDDSPLLLRYLRSQVPEQRWRTSTDAGVFFAKLSALALVPILALAALGMLGQAAPSIAIERALAKRSERVSATVLGAEPVSAHRYRLRYTFTLPGDKEGFGEALVGGVVPPEGQKIEVSYDPEEPYSNLPAPGQGLFVPSSFPVLAAFVIQLVLSIPYAIAIVAFKVRDDPFADWYS
jgi:hypothetical protein